MNPILIVGKPKSGKDTAGNLLAEITGEKKMTCSDIIYEDLACLLRVQLSSLRALDKESIRHILVAHGNHLCAKFPASLAVSCVQHGAKIICGIRRYEELNCFLDRYPEAKVIWVERPEIFEIRDNTEICKEMADFIVINDGTIEQLKQKIYESSILYRD